MQQIWVLEYETNGANTLVKMAFSDFKNAVDTAKRITSNGVAWPMEATLSREIRDSKFHEWEHDRDFPAMLFIDGDLQ